MRPEGSLVDQFVIRSCRIDKDGVIVYFGYNGFNPWVLTKKDARKFHTFSEAQSFIDTYVDVTRFNAEPQYIGQK